MADKTIKIPMTSIPFVVYVNGVKYVYEAGSEVTVPEEVAEVIEQVIKVQESPAPENGGGGTGGGADLLNADGVIKQEHLPEGYPYPAATYEGSSIFWGSWFGLNENGVFETYVAPQGLIAGETYDITWGSVTYRCVPVELEGKYCYGNIGALMGEEGTGEPFIITGDFVQDPYALNPTMSIFLLTGDLPEEILFSGLRKSDPERISKDYFPKSTFLTFEADSALEAYTNPRAVHAPGDVLNQICLSKTSAVPLRVGIRFEVRNTTYSLMLSFASDSASTPSGKAHLRAMFTGLIPPSGINVDDAYAAFLEGNHDGVEEKWQLRLVKLIN
jgi:hypothetical protein